MDSSWTSHCVLEGHQSSLFWLSMSIICLFRYTGVSLFTLRSDIMTNKPVSCEDIGFMGCDYECTFLMLDVVTGDLTLSGEARTRRL